MKRAVMWAGLVAIGCSGGSERPGTVGNTATERSLASFLPAQIEDLTLTTRTTLEPLPPPDAGAKYVAKDGRKVDIVLLANYDEERAKLTMPQPLAAGETRKSGNAEHKGFDIKGYPVVRTSTLSSSETKLGEPIDPAHAEMSSEATFVIARRVQVNVVVWAAKDPDDAIKYARALDLAGIETFARSLPRRRP